MTRMTSHIAMRTLLKIGLVVGVLLLPAPVLAGPIHLIGSFYAQEDFPFEGELALFLENLSDPEFIGTFDATVQLETNTGPVSLFTVNDLAGIFDASADLTQYDV